MTGSPAPRRAATRRAWPGSFMSYIAFDLDALNVVPDVAAASGLTPGDVAHGLLRLWAWCFREEVELVSEVHLRGFFSADAAGPALEAFGFLERAGNTWRVRGAQRYLRVKAAQREGGRKGRARSSSSVGQTTPPTSTPTSAPTSRSTSGSTSGSAQALTPSTEHRTPNVKEETSVELGSTGPAPIPAPTLELLPSPPPSRPPGPAPTPAQKRAASLTQDERDVFEHWRQACKHARAKLDPKRLRVVQERLKDYSVAELQRAIDGCARSAWHQGANDKHRRYDELELILRDARHVEEFQAMAEVARAN